MFFAQSAAADDVVLVTLGDSLTAGYGLSTQDGFAAQLQNWLGEAGLAAKVVNSSVSGDTTAGGLARVGWALTPDTDAVIVQLGANDFLRGLDPAQARQNLGGIAAEITARGLPMLIVGLPAPSNYGAEYKEAFDAIYPELAEAHDALLYEDFFAPLRARDVADIGDVMQPDGLHPNAAGVSAIVEAIGPIIARLVSEAAASSGAQAN